MNNLKQLSKSHGFSLIEVLITMLILAIGLLGIAALQFKGMKYSNDAGIRGNISMVAYDIADKIRLNSDKKASYVLTSAYTVPTTTPTGTCTQSSGSDATNDLNCWYRTLFENVPPGTQAQITSATSAIGDVFTVRLTWTDREGTTNNIDYSFMP